MSRRFLPIAAVLLAASLSAGAATTSFSQVVAIGDSLSDTGNLLALSGGQLPSAPYSGGRFSNGPVAVEYLAQGLGVSLNSLAFGGATTGFGNSQVPPGSGLENTGMLSQLAGYLAAQPGGVDSQALYVVWGGPNDFMDLLVNPADPTLAITAGITNLVTIAQTLYVHGAREFLLPLLPDLGMTPRALSLGAGVSSGGSALTDAFNAGLSNGYAQLAAALPDAKLRTFDVAAIQRQLMANPGLLGITETSTPCYSGFVNQAGAVCANPDTHFYWDNIHPTAVVHAALGQGMLAAVPHGDPSLVPEPATYALVALGLLGITFQRRRKT